MDELAGLQVGIKNKNSVRHVFSDHSGNGHLDNVGLACSALHTACYSGQAVNAGRQGLELMKHPRVS
jgi:hypothetical protein